MDLLPESNQANDEAAFLVLLESHRCGSPPRLRTSFMTQPSPRTLSRRPRSRRASILTSTEQGASGVVRTKSVAIPFAPRGAKNVGLRRRHLGLLGSHNWPG